MEIDGSATFYGDWVLFTSQDSHLYVLNRQTGEEVWKIAAGDQLQCAAVVVEGHAFLAGCDGLLHTVILDEQRDDGGVELNSPTGSTPAVEGDRLYFGTQQAGFLCVDWRKKEIVWRFTDNDGLGTVSGNACIIDDRVIFADDTRRVHALRKADGEVLWQTPLRTGVFASPLVVGQLVFIGDKAGRLYALDRGTGTIVWEREFQGGFQASPAVGFGRLVIASDEGVIYCLGKRTSK
jgi:outer membrane protein assembly factor BamB